MAQGLQPQNDGDTVTEARVLKVPEPPSVSPVSPVRLNSPSPKLTGKRPLPKAFLLTSAGVYSAALLDMHNTLSDMNYGKSHPGIGCHEVDPFARPFVSLPAPAYYATGLALATGVNWISWKMARSEKFRHVWFLPQLAAMAANGGGYAASARFKTAN